MNTVVYVALIVILASVISGAALFVALTMASFIRALVRTSAHRNWLSVIRNCIGYPAVKNLGGGWYELKCANCGATSTWWAHDEFVCSVCQTCFCLSDENTLKRLSEDSG